MLVRRFVLLALGLLVSTVGPRLLAFPVVGLGPDEVAYGLIAREITEGHWPYTAAFDHKPVGLYLPYAPFVAAFEESMTGLRVLALVTGVVGYLLAYAVARRIGLAAVPSVLLATAYGWFTLGNDGLAMLSEHLLDVYLLALVWLLLVRLRAVVALAFGALVALSVGTNYLSGPVVAAVGLFFLWRSRRRPMAWVCSALGFVVVTAALLAPVALWSDLGDYLALQAAFLGGYDPVWPSLGTRLAAWQGLLAPVGALVVVAATVTLLLPRTRTRAALKWWVLGAGTVVAVSLNQFFYHHYALLLAPVVVGLFAVLLRELPARQAVAVAGLVAAVAGWVGAVPVAPQLDQGARSILRQHDLGSDRTDPRMEAALALRETVRPGEVVYTRDVHFYLLTGTEVPTRFFFPSHHLLRQYTAVRDTTLDREMAGIVARRPVAVVLDDVATVPRAQDEVLFTYLEQSCAPPRRVAEARIWVCR